MARTPHTRTRRMLAATALALTGYAVLSAAAFAAPTPASGSAVIDGGTAEWDTTDGSPDFFSDMLRAGGNGNQTEVESKLYLRYDCATTTLSALVAAEPNITIKANLPDDSHIKIGGTKVVDGNSGDDGTAPDFAWVGLSGATATGWEASAIVAPGSYTINVHTQVEDDGSQTSAVPGRSIPLVLECDENPQPEPLEVVKTATTSYERTYPWMITKSATPATEVTTDQGTATFTYTVTATKGAPVDSNTVVAGTITVTNPNGMDVSDVDITDTIEGGPSCAVTEGLDRTIAKYGSVTVSYTCDVASSAPGTNVATATWTGGTSAGEAGFSFGEPNTVTNNTVDVLDAFNGGLPTLLPGGTGIAMTTTFTYTTAVTVPESGCKPYTNIATVVSGQTVLDQASATVKVCRAVPPVVTSPVVTPPVVTPPGITPPAAVSVGTPAGATLRIAKRGPARAIAGQLVTFTITVRNTNATRTATSVVLTDVLPAGYAIARRPTGSVLRKGRLVWTLGDLAPGASKTLRLQVRIDRNASGTRCNTALASAGNAATVRARACTRVGQVAGVSRIPIVTG